jgi:hypothetical protein
MHPLFVLQLLIHQSLEASICLDVQASTAREAHLGPADIMQAAGPPPGQRRCSFAGCDANGRPPTYKDPLTCWFDAVANNGQEIGYQSVFNAKPVEATAEDA